MPINLESWNCSTVTGGKGSGKSELERMLLSKFPSVFVFDTLEEFPEYEGRRYVPRTDNPMELESVARAVYNQGNCMLLVSESELYLPVGKNLPPNIFKIMTRGRHRNVGLMADTRRIANLNKTVFSLSDHCFIFHTWSPNDLDYLRGFIPNDVRGLASLPDYYFWHYSRGVVEVHDPIKLLPVRNLPTTKKATDS